MGIVEYLKNKPLEESYITNEFPTGTAGYITPEGELVILDEYHGEDDSLRDLGYVEFSNTHAEEDTCVRVFKNPTEEQYKQLEKIIDIYLDNEGYCKVEIWKPTGYDFYQVYSLFEDACQDYTWDENVGNWTGAKLVQIIKNYFNKNEAVGKGPIVDEKIKKYFYECVDKMYDLHFFEGDFILHYELINLEYGEALHTFGTYHWPNDTRGEGTIILNKYMFDEPEEAIKNTIYHELCHYVVFKWGVKLGVYVNAGWGKWVSGKDAMKFPASYWSSHGHAWKSIAAKVGNATHQIIKTTDSYTKHTGVGAEAEQRYNYILKCKHCGNEFKYTKRTDFVNSVLNGRGHTDRYWCRCRDGNKCHDFEIVKGR